MKKLILIGLLTLLAFPALASASIYSNTVVIDDHSETDCSSGCSLDAYIDDFNDGIIIRNIGVMISNPTEFSSGRVDCEGDRTLIRWPANTFSYFQLVDLSYSCTDTLEIFGDFSEGSPNGTMLSVVISYQTGTSTALPPIVVSSIDSGNISFGLAILITMVFLIFIGYIFNRLPGKKKIWA